MKGLETELLIRLPSNIYLQASHTWMKATDDTDNSTGYGNRLIYRPDQKIDIMAGMELWHFTMNLNFRHVSKRMTTSDNMNSLNAYQLLNGNIGFSYTLSKIILDTKLQLINVLDNTIYIIEGYPLAGREYRLTFGIRY